MPRQSALACCVDLPTEWWEMDGEASYLPGRPPSVITGS
jgi:hypothetical protein